MGPRKAEERGGTLNIPAVLRIIGGLLLGTAAAMIPPAVLGVGEGLVIPWLGAIGVTGVIGAALWLGTPHRPALNHRTGLAVVGCGWAAVAGVGALPFLFTGVAGVTESLFESVSGFTTTGATVFVNVEALPPSILLWRSLSQWFGGMGVIILGVAILPFIGVGGAQLFYSEAPGIPTNRLNLRIASTARLLFAVYAWFTALTAAVYIMFGLTIFDAFNHALTSVAAGGFSTRNGSFGAFSAAVQWVAVLAMLFAGTNFALHLRLVNGRWGAWVRDLEWRVFVGAILSVAVVCAVAEARQGQTWGPESARDAVFNVVAVATTSGFHTTDYATWPVMSQVLILALMFAGAMGGSTGGGFKMVRVVVLTKLTWNSFRRVLHPSAVVVTQLGTKPVRPGIALSIVGLFSLFALSHGIGTAVLAALGSDLLTATSAALAAISNVGPGLGAVGPAGHYGNLPGAAQLTLGGLMLLGRLEFYALLILLWPRTWSGSRRRRTRPIRRSLRATLPMAAERLIRSLEERHSHVGSEGFRSPKRVTEDSGGTPGNRRNLLK